MVRKFWCIPWLHAPQLPPPHLAWISRFPIQPGAWRLQMEVWLWGKGPCRFLSTKRGICLNRFKAQQVMYTTQWNELYGTVDLPAGSKVGLASFFPFLLLLGVKSSDESRESLEGWRCMNSKTMITLKKINPFWYRGDNFHFTLLLKNTEYC